MILVQTEAVLELSSDGGELGISTFARSFEGSFKGDTSPNVFGFSGLVLLFKRRPLNFLEINLTA